jgi:predicted small secreted protein
MNKPMKKTLLVTLGAILLASCSGNENTNPGAGTTMTYKIIETYTPSKAAYEDQLHSLDATHEVQHFENGLVTDDTIFNKTGNALYSIVTTGNDFAQTVIRTQLYSNVSEIYNYTYDGQGRITGYEDLLGDDMHYKFTYTYNDDFTVSKSLHNFKTGETADAGYYTINSSGLISKYDVDNQHESIQYQNSVPVSYTLFLDDEEPFIRTFSYYSTAVPSNLRKTNVQANNLAMLTGLSNVIDNTAYYPKLSDPAQTYDSTFNASGYITHTYFTPALTYYIHETFYYYN